MKSKANAVFIRRVFALPAVAGALCVCLALAAAPHAALAQGSGDTKVITPKTLKKAPEGEELLDLGVEPEEEETPVTAAPQDLDALELLEEIQNKEAKAKDADTPAEPLLPEIAGEKAVLDKLTPSPAAEAAKEAVPMPETAEKGAEPPPLAPLIPYPFIAGQEEGEKPAEAATTASPAAPQPVQKTREKIKPTVKIAAPDVSSPQAVEGEVAAEPAPAVAPAAALEEATPPQTAGTATEGAAPSAAAKPADPMEAKLQEAAEATARKAKEKPKPVKHELPSNLAQFDVPDSNLSPRTRRLLAFIPSGIDSTANRVQSREVVIDRADPTAGMAANEGFEKTGEGIGITVNAPQTETAADVDALLDDAYQALISGQPEVSTAIYKKILTVEPENRTALFGIATTYHKNGQRKQALQYYEELLSYYPDHREGLNNFLVLMSEEAPEEALKELEILERKNPEFSPIPAQMAMILLKIGEKVEAARKLAKAVKLSPDNLSYRYNLAIIQDSLGNKKEAALLYEQILEAVAKGGPALPGSVAQIEDRLTYLRSGR